MYFDDKFNTEIQQIIRNIYPLTVKTTIGNFNTNIFKKVQVVQRLPDGTEKSMPTVKVYPLTMCNKLESSNKNDYVSGNRVVVAHNYVGTVISATKDKGGEIT